MNSRRGPSLVIVFAVICLALGAGRSIARAGDNGTPGPEALAAIEVLDLETAARMAIAGNPTIEAAMARVEQAREAMAQAKSVYWPRLDATLAGSRVSLSENAFETQQLQVRTLYGANASVDDPETFYTAGLAASWVLFDGFARKFNLAAADYGVSSSQAARDDTQRLLLQAVTSAFLSAQLALENISIAKADESFNQRQLTEARLRYDVGTGALSDVLNFEVKANSAQAERIVAQRAYETARIGLAALLGAQEARLPKKTRLSKLTSITEAELVLPRVEDLIETAHSLRPDLQQSQWGVQQAQANAKAKQAGYYPTISLSATYTGERTDDLGFESDDFGNTVGLNLTYNIFSGGLTRSQHQEAKAQLREAQKLNQSAKIGVNADVRSAVAQVRSAQQQLLLQRTNAQLVKQNRDLVEKEYKAGVGSLVRLNEAQRDLIRAQVSLAAARKALRQAWYDLRSVTGEIAQAFN